VNINGLAWSILGCIALFAVSPFVVAYFRRRAHRKRMAKIRRLP
jgi:hypothetical protein